MLRLRVGRLVVCTLSSGRSMEEPLDEIVCESDADVLNDDRDDGRGWKS